MPSAILSWPFVGNSLRRVRVPGFMGYGHSAGAAMSCTTIFRPCNRVSYAIWVSSLPVILQSNFLAEDISEPFHRYPSVRRSKVPSALIRREGTVGGGGLVGVVGSAVAKTQSPAISGKLEGCGKGAGVFGTGIDGLCDPAGV